MAFDRMFETIRFKRHAVGANDGRNVVICKKFEIEDRFSAARPDQRIWRSRRNRAVWMLVAFPARRPGSPIITLSPSSIRRASASPEERMRSN